MSMQAGILSTVKYPCSSKHFGKLIGVKGQNIQMLRQQSGAEIHVPSRKSPTHSSSSSPYNPITPMATDSSSELTIIGTLPQIEKAIQLIDSLLNEPEYTHFIALMLPTPQSHPTLHTDVQALQNRFSYFHDDSPFRFCSPTELHLTLCMLELKHPHQVQQASQLLMSVECPKPITLRLNQLNSFREKSRTIHANIDSHDQTLNELASQVLNLYHQASFIKEKPLLNYHVTLIKGYCPHTQRTKAFKVPSLSSVNSSNPISSWFRIPYLALCKREKVIGSEGTPCYFVEKKLELPY